MHTALAPRRATATRRFGLTAALLAACCGGAGRAAGPDPTCGLSDFSTTALTRINQLRAVGADCRSAGRFAPAAALRWNPLLARAAERHAQDMVANHFFSHTGSDGSTIAARVGATGYAWRLVGENLALGHADIDSVVAGWAARDGHCANLMDPAFTDVGLVCVAGTAATAHRHHWTLDLARAH